MLLSSVLTSSPPFWRLLSVRHHLLELHEQTWFPKIWRAMFQGGLGRAQAAIGAYDQAAPLISRFLDDLDAHEILDLCSGSAEVITRLQDQLENRPRVVVSDLFPDLSAFQHIKTAHRHLDYHPEPVNAFRPPAGGPTVRSIIAALHHFHPDEVRTILTDAALNADGIIVLESTSRTWKQLLTTLFLPLPAALITAFGLRPWRLHHVLWGLLLPVIPLVAMLDGLVSCLRTHTPGELRKITSSIDAPDFEWEIGTVPMGRSKLHSTYLLGRRISRVKAVSKSRAAQAKKDEGNADIT